MQAVNGDPARMAQNFAGVKGAADHVNDIIIRGEFTGRSAQETGGGAYPKF